MPITADPIIIPSKTLDKFWVHSLAIGTTGVNGAALLNCSLLPYNDTGDVGTEIQLDIIDVFEQVTVDPDAAQIFALFMAYVEKKAKEQGKI